MTDKHERRRDPQGYTTKVTRLDDGYGCRILHGDRIVAEGHASNRDEVPTVLADLLRWLDKVGSPSEMASASRDRNTDSGR